LFHTNWNDSPPAADCAPRAGRASRGRSG
jgi:hypothetical protein